MPKEVDRGGVSMMASAGVVFYVMCINRRATNRRYQNNVKSHQTNTEYVESGKLA
jgi:hypothetical protein